MSENQKKIFSLIAAAALTLVIVVVWFSAGEKTSADKAAVEESKLSSLSPMQVIRDEFSKAFSGFNESVPDLDISSTSSIPIEIIEVSTSTASTTIN